MFDYMGFRAPCERATLAPPTMGDWRHPWSAADPTIRLTSATSYAIAVMATRGKSMPGFAASGISGNTLRDLHGGSLAMFAVTGALLTVRSVAHDAKGRTVTRWCRPAGECVVINL